MCVRCNQEGNCFRWHVTLGAAAACVMAPSRILEEYNL